MKNTKELIVQKALELFNEKGIEYGGMRELAALLNMRVGNITYYFATKDDLVGELMNRLAEANTNTAKNYDLASLKGLLKMYREMFHNQYIYKCLFMSLVHLFTHHKGLVEQYKITEKKRKQRLADACKAMIDNGYLKQDADYNINGKIIAHVSLIARFWISESIVSYYDKSTEYVMCHYLNLISDEFLPYATSKGKKDIEAFLTEIT
ncbi:MAG: TetR/AcrR family transcriptional regulator [Flavipsychrobacter sp.]|jgi:AcrR family transcriptional regulator|nr:TetR/AcrR family transcriptional regulator [Flavipsychrobacter sp.]